MSALLATNSTVFGSRPPAPRSEARLDTLDGYLPSPEALATVPWLVRLDLDSPRRTLRCLPPSTRRWKRVMDVVGALVLLAITFPLMLLAVLLIKLTSRGPAIFRQVRVGLNVRDRNDRRRNSHQLPGPPHGFERRLPGRDRRGPTAHGRPFVLYKFRTMTVDAEKNGAQFAQRRDSRVTAVGRILRKTRIDELPQLWNVLKGEMSLVGPRPERPEFIDELSRHIPNYVNRLGLKPGLTGVAQVVNGYDNEIEGFRRKVTYDLLYLQNCCLRNDIKILLRTVRVVLTGSGAL